jgi:hypothetical protein
VTHTDLVHRSTVTEIVRAYVDACAVIRECHARLAAAEADINARLATVPGSRTGIRLPVVLPYGGHGDLDAQLMSLRLAVWSHLIDRLGIWRLCSTKRAEQLRAQLDPSAYRRRHYGDNAPEELPEITEDNVLGMVRGFASSLDTLLDESIREVFDLLRPREVGSAARYKRPRRDVVGSFAVLTYAVERGYSGGFHVSYGGKAAADLMALENCFRALDGKGGAPASHRSELDLAIEASADGRGVTTYFRFRCFKNRALHLTLLRPDLVAELNRRAGGKNFKRAA